MSQLVIMNKENALVSLGIRVQFFDKINPEDEVGKIEGYSIVYRDNSKFDGWLIFSGDPENEGPWVFIHGPVIDKLEILGEL